MTTHKEIHSPVVIGGMVMDFRGQPALDLQLYTSNPGYLRQMPGGVGRNICENLCRLELHPFLISVLGKDLMGDALLHHTASLGLSQEGILQPTDKHTATYLAIIDQKGDLHTAIADMEILESITPAQILQFESQIKKAPLIVADTNLSPDSIEVIAMLCKKYQIPLWIEPVSAEKSKKVIPHLKDITYLSPDLNELAALTGEKQLTENKQIQDAALSLIDTGLKQILITLGEKGVLLVNQKTCIHYPALPTQVVDVTGAGDAFVAGTIYGLLTGYSIQKAIYYGLITARQTIEVAETVNPRLDKREIDIIYGGVLNNE